MSTEEKPTPRKGRVRRWILRTLLGFLVLFGLLAVVMIAEGWAAFGKAPRGERLERMKESEQWQDGVFENPQPIINDNWLMVTEALSASEYGSPDAELPVETVPKTRFDEPPASGLRVTWFGHSSLLIEIEGRRFLTDPIWSDRSSPIGWVGPERWYPPLIPLSDLPPVDAVLISHDHYDHLDHETIVAIREWDTTFIAPLGVGAHLEYWGVPSDHIVELDWWDRRSFGGVELVATPARHASGRHLFDQFRTLWAGYALVGAERRVFFSGDTGLFPGMEEIGERLGPFDITMLEVGAYGQAWPDWHLGPEQAVRAHQMLRGELLLPVHWGLFNLAYHAWTEPIERVLVEARQQDVRVASPRPGVSIEPGDATIDRWWPEVPWRTAEEYPIVASQVD